MKKIQRQSRPETRAPPTVGPATVARPATADHTPKAAPRRSAGKTALIRARVCGIITAAPRPWTARAVIICPGVSTNPQTAEATVKTASPVVKVRCAPNRSPSRPESSSSVAKTSM